MPIFEAVAVGLKVGQAIFGNKAGKKRKKSRRLQADIQKIRNRQAKRKFLKDFRQAQANALIQGVASGATGSSATAGTAASQESQLGFALFEQQQQEQLAARSGKALDKADKFSFQAGLFGAAADIAPDVPSFFKTASPPESG